MKQYAHRLAGIVLILTMQACLTTESGVGNSEDSESALEDEALQTAETSAALETNALCTFPNFTYYPGNAFPLRERYGHAVVEFQVCGGSSPWQNVTVKADPNRIGGALLYDFQNEIARVTSQGDDPEGSWRTYRASFDVMECPPPMPCSHRGTFNIYFHVEIPRPGFGDPFVAYQGRSAPYPFALYSTP